MKTIYQFLITFGMLITSNSIFAQTQDDFADLAVQQAPEIAREIVSKQGGTRYRVSVFPFGDANGNITMKFNEPSKWFQGEMISALMNVSAGKFDVVDAAGLARKFKNAGIDPSGVSSADADNAAKVMSKVGLEAVIVGSIEAESQAQVFSDMDTKINVNITIIFKDGTTAGKSGSTKPDQIPPPTTLIGGRFSVQIFLGNDAANLVEIPLVSSKDPDSEFHKVFFAEIPDSIPLGDLDKSRYRIRISNKGVGDTRGYVNPDPAKEKNRLYGVAVLVDGVNSFYQKNPNGEVGPVVLHPKNCSKWILSGPNKKIVPAQGGYNLQDTSNAGHSIIDIPGFQRSGTYADAFVFAKAEESIAETVGITNDIGLISVHFYQEELPGDEIPIRITSNTNYSAAGTKAGPQVLNPVFTVNPKLRPNPCEVWRIFYRTKSTCPIPDADKIPVVMP